MDQEYFTVGLVMDSTNVCLDPAGLNRSAIGTLAAQRKMIKEFDISLLSNKGFRVLVEERDITLPRRHNCRGEYI